MAQQTSLNLSVLKEDVEYPLTPGISEGRCLIHVKLTESCARAIDNLITSHKGAFFSLWFTQNGGHLSIQSSGEGIHKFQFSIARLDKVETHSKLECLHQQLNTDKKSLMSCMGLMEHKLTIKATDDVYETTKKRATQLEKERKGVSTKEIKIPKVVSKSKQHLGSTPRLPHKSLISNKPSMVSGTSGDGVGLGKSLPMTPKSLRQRVMYLLALKPFRRHEILLKLKKATKRGESSLTNLDSVLAEVSDIHDGSVYHLKPALYHDLNVDSWPFYSEAEKALVKRKLQTVLRQPPNTDPPTNSSTDENTITGNKRQNEEHISQEQLASKKPKFSSNSSVTSADSFHTTNSFTPVVLTETSNVSIEDVVEQSETKHNKDIECMDQPLPIGTENIKVEKTDLDSSFESNQIVSPPKDGMEAVNVAKSEMTKSSGGSKHKKKKKHKHNETQVKEVFSHKDNHSSHVTTMDKSHVATQPVDTVDIPDFSSQFPPITMSEERRHYKNLFNEEYEEYLSLKKTIDNMHEEVMKLTYQLDSLPQHSPEIKDVKAKIKEKFVQMQQDSNYQEKKTHLLNLHYKLDHLKKMVVQYDSTHS